jgi:hypothetical protein
MNPALIAMLGGCALFLAGCSGNSPNPGSQAPEPSLPTLPVNPELGGPIQSKPRFDNAQQLSDQVTVGMPQSAVESMFGPPDRAGYKTYGAATGSPWRALVWEWVFDDVNPPRVLSIVFQEQNGAWRVNHGDWP